jgi:hypothetical protein
MAPLWCRVKRVFGAALNYRVTAFLQPVARIKERMVNKQPVVE